MEKQLIIEDLIFKTDNKKFDKIFNFQKLKTVQSFGKVIAHGVITIDMSDQEQNNLLRKIQQI